MKSKKIVIVGGVAGGASTAARLRRLDEQAEIVLVERGEFISFANCGLPYFIGGIIKGENNLLVQTPAGMKARFNLDIRTRTEAVEINRGEKKVKLKDLISGKEYDEIYDYLVLSPGAEPVRPPIPGIDASNIFTLRNIPDTLTIEKYAGRDDVRTALVIGGGFIGLEMAENLKHRGLAAAVVEMTGQVMPPFDFDMAALIHKQFKDQNVGLYLNSGVKSFVTENNLCTGVVLENGKTLQADMIVLSIGVRPESSLAAKAGLKTGARGGIVVDSSLKTEDPSIIALGDAVEVVDFIDGSPLYVPLAGPANKQGRIAADLIAGRKDSYDGTLGTSIVKFFEMTAACTGQNEKTLKKKGVPYEKCFIHTGNHAGYYPGAKPISLKLLFSTETGKVLGAQIVGFEGVDKRIDVIAAALYAGLTVTDLTRLELSYAPPFSSAKDPVNMAGYVAENILNKTMSVIHWHDVKDLDLSRVQLVNVATQREFQLSTIPGSMNIPVDELRTRLNELDKSRPTVVYCQVGLRGYIAARILMQNGFHNVRNISGSLRTWTAAVDNQENPVLG